MLLTHGCGQMKLKKGTMSNTLRLWPLSSLSSLNFCRATDAVSSA
jgi:hypothetical protein